MKHYLSLFALLSMLALSAVAAPAQSYRLNSLSEQLATQADDLAERSYSDYANGSFRTRADVEALYLAQQFSASARVFRRMISDGRRESELRDAVALLSELQSRADRDFSRRTRWSDVRSTLNDIEREIGGGGFGGGRRDDSGRRDDDGFGGRTSGRVRWRGTVDDNIQLVIRGDQLEIRTIGGSPYGNGTANFTSPLPQRRGVNVNATLINGRGEVRVLQQPTRDNDFTAVVEIRDPKGGAREYEIEVSW